MRAWAIVTAAVSAALTLACTSCTATVAGVPALATADDPPSVTRPLDQVLPTAQELAQALGIGPGGLLGQLVEGGADTLLAGVDRSQATPEECVSVTYRLQRLVYGSSPVQAVATRSWAGGGTDGPSSSAFFGVVKLAGAADARRFFDAAARMWQQCDGQTVVLEQAGVQASTRVTDVANGSRIVSAVLVRDGGGPTVQRALGVAADCIVDVEVTDHSGTAGAEGAIDVAATIIGKATGS